MTTETHHLPIHLQAYYAWTVLCSFPSFPRVSSSMSHGLLVRSGSETHTSGRRCFRLVQTPNSSLQRPWCLSKALHVASCCKAHRGAEQIDSDQCITAKIFIFIIIITEGLLKVYYSHGIRGDEIISFAHKSIYLSMKLYIWQSL